MTTPQRRCRYCGEVITDPDDAVYLGHEESQSGPGWEYWAHTDHAELVEPDPAYVDIMARLLIVRAFAP